ncbi:MAG: preprotein translocase subunit SecE [Clostridiaceae bacterium]
MAVNGKVIKEEKVKSKGIMGLYNGIVSELRRITWAPKEDVKKATVAVIFFIAIFTLLISAMDFGSNNLYKLIFK